MKIAIACFSNYLGQSEQEAIKYFSLFSKIQPTTIFVKKNTEVYTELLNSLSVKSHLKVDGFNFHSDWNPFFILALRERIIKNKIQVIILFSMTEAKSIMLAIRGLDIRLILRQDFFKKNFCNDWLEKYTMERIDAFVPASQHVAANFQSAFEHMKNEQKPTMIYSFVDCDERSIQESFEEKNNFIKNEMSLLEILHLGEVEPKKGQLEALSAIKHLKDQSCAFKLTFVGEIIDRDYYQCLVRYIEKYNLEDVVVFAGYQKDAKTFYQKAHLLLCPAYGEGQPNVYVDAMSHGLPILAFENSIFLELKLLGFNVHLAKDKDQRCLNIKLESMAKSMKEVLRAAMDRNLTVVHEYFSSDRIAKQWLQLLRSL